MNGRRSFVRQLLVGLAALCATAAVASDSPTQAENGRRLYLRVGCHQCHGTVGQGGSAGPRLAPGPMPLEALRAFLRNTTRAMPAYPETVLGDAAIADLYAYLRSIPPSPAPRDLPALRGLE